MLSPIKFMLWLLRLGLVVATFLVVTVQEASAVPVFARKYGRSCATCHVVFPRLSPFGMAFRRNGYRFPTDNDEAIREAEEPISMGAEAYKQVWPDAIWPGTLPSMVPVAAVLRASATIQPERETNDFDLTEFTPAADIYIAGAISESISYLGKFQVGGPDCTNCHDYGAVQFSDIVPDSYFKVGRFQPEYFSFHQQPFFEFHYALHGRDQTSRKVGAASAWNLGKQWGVEWAGTLAGRARYVVGMVEGDIADLSSWKDFYGRVGYKFGGMRLDGRKDNPISGDNWVDNSFEISAMAYRGTAERDVPGAGPLGDQFYAWGGDGTFTWGDFATYGGTVFEWHSQPAADRSSIMGERYFIGMKHVIYPWLMPSVNFDYFNSELEGDQIYQWRGRIEALILANLRARADVLILRDVYSPVRFDSLILDLTIGL